MPRFQMPAFIYEAAHSCFTASWPFESTWFIWIFNVVASVNLQQQVSNSASISSKIHLECTQDAIHGLVHNILWPQMPRATSIHSIEDQACRATGRASALAQHLRGRLFSGPHVGVDLTMHDGSVWAKEAAKAMDSVCASKPFPCQLWHINTYHECPAA